MAPSEGDVFEVPLSRGGFGIGVVARAGRNMVLAYFFNYRIDSADSWPPSERLEKEAAIWIKMRWGPEAQ